MLAFSAEVGAKKIVGAMPALELPDSLDWDLLLGKNQGRRLLHKSSLQLRFVHECCAFVK